MSDHDWGALIPVLLLAVPFILAIFDLATIHKDRTEYPRFPR